MKKFYILALIITFLSAAPAEAAFSEFAKICLFGSLEQIEAAIKAGADVNEKDKFGVAPLMWIAQFQDNGVVLNALIRAGADVNAKSGDDGMTPLMFAAVNPYLEVTSALLAAGADVNAKMIEDWTPLMIAVRSNKNPEVVNALIRVGADVNAKTDVNAKAEGGRTPLNFAVEKSTPEIVSLLLKAGADVSENDVELAQKNELLKDTAVIEELKKKLKK